MDSEIKSCTGNGGDRRGIVLQIRPVQYVNNVRLLSMAESRLPRFRCLYIHVYRLSECTTIM